MAVKGTGLFLWLAPDGILHVRKALLQVLRHTLPQCDCAVAQQLLSG